MGEALEVAEIFILGEVDSVLITNVEGAKDGNTFGFYDGFTLGLLLGTSGVAEDRLLLGTAKYSLVGESLEQ